MITEIYIHATEPKAKSKISGYRTPRGDAEYIVLHIGDHATIFLTPENAERLSAELAKLQTKQEAA